MSTRVYPVILRAGESGKFIAECPSIIGCLTQGDTLNEALVNIREAIELCLEDLMKCVHCQGELKFGRAPFHIDRKGVHLTIDEAPAWVCSECGEPLFEASTVESIQAIIRAVDEQAEKLAQSA